MKKTCDIPFYTHYNPPPKVSVKFSKPSLTQQQFRQEADINNIIASVNNAGTVNNPLWTGPRQPIYGDFASIPAADYMSAQNMLLDANNNFMALPSEVRKRFNNNPAELLAYIQGNPPVEELARLGLAPPVEQEKTLPPEANLEGEK